MLAKEAVSISEMSLSPLNNTFDLSVFDCGREDINEFLHDYVLNYQAHKLANTFVFHEKGKISQPLFSASLTTRSMSRISPTTRETGSTGGCRTIKG